jgi:hypothetical protein
MCIYYYCSGLNYKIPKVLDNWKLKYIYIFLLMYKFNLKCSIHMQINKPTIYIHSKSIKQIKPKLLQIFPISMKYKL